MGRGVGPVLEARDVLSVLEGNGPHDLRVKSERLAQVLLDATSTDLSAGELIETGRALDTFRAILAAQNGDPNVSVGDLVPGSFESTVTTTEEGTVTHIDNRRVNELARRAGSPKDNAASVSLHCRVGDEVDAGDAILTIHAEKVEKLEHAKRFASDTGPVRVLLPTKR